MDDVSLIGILTLKRVSKTICLWSNKIEKLEGTAVVLFYGYIKIKTSHNRDSIRPIRHLESLFLWQRIIRQHSVFYVMLILY